MSVLLLIFCIHCVSGIHSIMGRNEIPFLISECSFSTWPNVCISALLLYPLGMCLLLPDLFRTQQGRIICLCIRRCQALCPGTLQHSSACLHTSSTCLCTSQKVYLRICKVMISITFLGFIYFSCFYGNCTGYGNEP